MSNKNQDRGCRVEGEKKKKTGRQRRAQPNSHTNKKAWKNHLHTQFSSALNKKEKISSNNCQLEFQKRTSANWWTTVWFINRHFSLSTSCTIGEDETPMVSIVERNKDRKLRRRISFGRKKWRRWVTWKRCLLKKGCFTKISRVLLLCFGSNQMKF